MKKIYVLFLLALSSVIMMSCGESAESYNKRAYAFADSTILYTDVNFELASDMQTMWRSVIFDSQYQSPVFHLTSFCNDFNSGIAKFKTDLEAFPAVIKTRPKYVDSVFATLKDAPSKSASVLANIKELFSCYTQSLDAVNNPSGSLQTYTENINTLFTKYKDLKTKISIDRK